MATRLNRRQFLTTSLAAATGVGARDVYVPAIVHAQEPIRIGQLIPFTESLRLAEAAGGRAELTLLDTFHHTGAQPFWWSWRARVADGWNLARLADTLVRIDRHRR